MTFYFDSIIKKFLQSNIKVILTKFLEKFEWHLKIYCQNDIIRNDIRSIRSPENCILKAIG
jgi:hypothetical protein